MRMLMKVTLPHGRFNAAVKDGSVEARMGRILEDLKPEAVYFTEFGGRRTGLIFVDMQDVSQIPSLAEPWFLQFDADVEIHPVMTPEDLKKAGLAGMGKKWG